MPQSQTAALPRPKEEEETDKSKQAQTEQTYTPYALQQIGLNMPKTAIYRYHLYLILSITEKIRTAVVYFRKTWCTSTLS